ncbi:MAG: helix-turn-helix domain-containing protein [Faecousia sp.]
MFYDRFIALCAQRGESPSRAALNAGISKAVVSKWKQNPDAFPSGPVAKKLANYFGITISDLLNKDLTPEELVPSIPVRNPNSPAAQGKTLAQAAEEAQEQGEAPLPAPSEPETFYDRFVRISRSYGMSPSGAALAAGLSKSSVSKWKREPDSYPTGTVLAKLSAFFGIPASELLGEEKVDAPSPVSDEAIKFALFGGSEDITQEMYDEVRSFAAFVKEREANKRGKE